MPVPGTTAAFALLRAVVETCEPHIESAPHFDVAGAIRAYNRITETGRRDMTRYDGNLRNDVFYNILFQDVNKTDILWAWLRLGYEEYTQHTRPLKMWDGLKFLLKLQWKSAKTHEAAST